jgi:hypothetical protein
MKLKRNEIGYLSQCGRFEFERVAIATKSGNPKHGRRLFFNDRPVGDRLLDSLDECKQLAQDTLDAQPQPEPPTLVVGFDQPNHIVL